MTTQTNDLTRPSALEAPLASPELIGRIGDAIWLYLRFLTLATTSGHVCRARSSLARDLGTVEGQVDRWVAVLSNERLITVVSPGPFLVTKLRFWSGRIAGSTTGQATLRKPASPSLEDVPVSSKQLAAASSNLGDRGQGEGDDILAEAVALLGPEAHDEVRDLLRRVPVFLIRRTLRRVALTPNHKIKKSRLALFRYLLAKFSDDRS